MSGVMKFDEHDIFAAITDNLFQIEKNILLKQYQD